MPRLHYITKARKDQGHCQKCRTEIKRGDSYKHFSFRHGGKRIYCASCMPRASEMTQSEIKGNAYSLQEDAEDRINELSSASDPEELHSALEEIREEATSSIQEIVDLIEEKLDNIESGCGHTDLPIYEELDERRSNYEDWQSEMESADVEEFSHDVQCPECGGALEVEEADQEDGSSKRIFRCSDNHAHEIGEDQQQEWLDALESWLADQTSTLQDALGSCPE
jgi:hypothetical protein